MRKRSVYPALFLMLFTAQSWAGNVEVAQWIPWSFISSEIQKLPLAVSSEPASIDLNAGEIKPKLLGTRFQVQGEISQIHLDQNGVQALAQNLNAKISVGSLNIDQVIVRDFGGNQIQIRIQAVCQPFEIQLSNLTVGAQAPFVRQKNAWSPSLTQVNLQIPQGSWKVSPISCQGPQGLDQKIVTQIQEALNNPVSLQDYLKAWLAPKIDELWSSTWNSLTQQAWQSLKVDSMGEPTEKGFYLLGHLETKNPAQVTLPANLEIPAEDGLRLFLSTEGFAALAQDQVASFSVENYNLQNIPAFSGLMHNRFAQFFVWPDLMHCSRDLPVYLSTLPQQNHVTLQPKSAGTWALTLQTTGVIRLQRKGQLRNYINWGLGMGSTLTTDVKDSQLSLKTLNSKSNLKWQFDPEYIKAFDPNTRISSSVLNQATKSLFENRSMQVALPVLTWKERQWKLNGWKQQGSMISMEWK